VIQQMRSSPAVALRSANSISFDILTVVSLPSTETQLRKSGVFFCTTESAPWANRHRLNVQITKLLA